MYTLNSFKCAIVYDVIRIGKCMYIILIVYDLIWRNDKTKTVISYK